MVARVPEIGDFPALVSAVFPGNPPIDIILRSQRELDLFVRDLCLLFPGRVGVLNIVYGLEESDIEKLLSGEGR